MGSPAEFLERLRSGGLVFGQYIWDGEKEETITSVNFEWSKHDPTEVVNQRALEFLEQLTLYDWATNRIEIDVRYGRHVRCTMKPSRVVVPIKIPGATARLRQLAARAEGRVP